MSTFTFGKYKGCRYEDIAHTDPSYFRWALENVDGFRTRTKGIVVQEGRTIPVKSSCGHGHIKNAGFPRPGKKKFVSRASPQYGKQAPQEPPQPRPAPVRSHSPGKPSKRATRPLEALEDHLDITFMEQCGSQFDEFPDDQPPW